MLSIRKNNNSPIFLGVLFNFVIIIILSIYIIYLRFIPYITVEYDGYAVNGKKIQQNLMNTTFDVDQSIKALKVSDQDDIYQNLNSYYLGASKKDSINLNYPIYVNDSLALYNLSSDAVLITDNFTEVKGYTGFTLTSGALYNTATLQRADYYDYLFMKNDDGLYINTKEIKIKTSFNDYTIPMNSIINFTNYFITYYTLQDDEFIYGKIIDIDESSTVIVEDYDKEYTYKTLLLGLKITKEKNETKQKDNDITNEITNEVVDNSNENIINDVVAQEPIQEEQEEVPGENLGENLEGEPGEEQEEPTQEPSYGDISEEIKWVKPTVECTEFTANVYSASTEVKITDPRRVIYKAVTFSFYKDGNLAFRASTTNSGSFQITKLLPDTTYKIIGTYQYTNKDGSLMESKFTEQEITTSGIQKLNSIDLEFENGRIYSNKIEIKNIRIASDINDEALLGVSKAEIIINGVTYKVSSNVLKNIIKGETITYQSQEGLSSNTKCEYEIRFYDTAGNKMKLNNNKGNTNTSKKAPSTQITVTTQEVIAVNARIQLTNEDDIELKNYRYILYSSTGEIIKQDKILDQDITITFDDLDLENVYTIKVYADYNIEDGNGTQYNQEIGRATFTTVALRQLGTLKLNVSYNSNNDVTSNSINLSVGINTVKTDARLIKILKEVKIQIQDSNNFVIDEISLTDINALTAGGVKNLIRSLNSNTTYNIVITATVKQGNTEQKVNTSYTVTKFTTNKQNATLNIKNLIATTNMIDMDVYIDDIDGACLSDIVTLRLTDKYSKEYIPSIEPTDSNDNTKIKSNTQIPTKKWVRLTFEDLKENETYTLSCESKSYNITNENSKIQNNYIINKVNISTTGLGGSINLMGMQKELLSNSSNIIDVTSTNNWYSQCFDSLQTKYTLLDNYEMEFNITSKYNYGKTCLESENEFELILLSNQCYVYDFRNYIGQTITISFYARTTNEDAKVYLQEGKSIGENITEITGLKTAGWTRYTQTLTVPKDGYVGFYLEKYIRTTITPAETDEYGNIIKEEITTKAEEDYNLYIKNLKVELGKEATAYEKYQYNSLAEININFIDTNHKTYDSSDGKCKYYIRIISSKNETKEFEYDYDSNINIERNEKYEIEETTDAVQYTIQLIIKQNSREYVLDTIQFEYNPENKQEIKSISTVEDFLNIQPYGNYILLNDLDLTNVETASQYTFGSPNISFYGSIDFNGKTIKRNTYSLETQKETTSYLFYKLEESAKLENVVIDYYINNPNKRSTVNINAVNGFIVKEDGIYSLFLYNNAVIDNVRINLKESTEKERINVGLMGYKNEGKIQNFIINFENKLYGSQYIAGICLESTGTIQNGYIYGEGIEGIGNITTGDYRYIAGAVVQQKDKALMQNVYNISTITINHCNSTYSYAANFIYNLNGGSVKNIYSVMPIVTVFEGEEYYAEFNSNNSQVYFGPNIINNSSGKVTDSYYFCDVDYEINDYNVKFTATGLYESEIQNLILNANGYEQFEIDKYVDNSYYPHLYLNYCMPKQDNIGISSAGNEIIDILSSEYIKNIDKLDLSDKVKQEIETYKKTQNNIDYDDENTKIIEFRIYNPSGATISKIQMQYLQCDIMSQTYSKKISTVYVIANEPTSYLNSYDVELIQATQANGRIKESKYGEKEDLGTRTVDITFIKKISTAEQWYNINNEDENGVSGLIQNYRLIADINFENSEYSPYITGTFTGYIDGEYNGIIHTIKNIEGSQPLIENLSGGTIKNIYVNKFILNTSLNYAGLIGQTNNTVTVDNINVTNMEIYSSCNSSPCVGGIVAYINNGNSSTVKNCSVQGLTIELTNSSSTNVSVGGIVGCISGSFITTENCYVQNLYINAFVNSYYGVGGIIGYAYSSFFSYIDSCYTTGKINANYMVGGILGNSDSSGVCVVYCYSTISINSRVTQGSANIGGIAGSGAEAKNNLFAGSIYVSGNNVANVKRIRGDSNAGSDNYAYKDQLINGEVSNNLLGATKLLSDTQIFDIDTYIELQFNCYELYVENSDGKYASIETLNIFPLLNDTYGHLLPNQKYVTLDNDIKLATISSTPSEDGTEVTVVMKFEIANKSGETDDITFTNVKIENDDMQVVEGTWKCYKDTDSNSNSQLTVAEFVATPNRAYESYKIETIYYEKNGITVYKDINTKIKVTLYKAISSAEDWNTFFAEEGDGRKYTGQNIKITGDIDFKKGKVESNVIIGRFEADSTKTISNIKLSNLSANSGFIKEIKTSFENIDFKDCEIMGNGSYIGLVSILRGTINNCNFENITINCSGNYDYIAIISRCIAGSINNINLKNINITGRNYVGGLCGQTSSLGSSGNITGTYIKVTGTDYVGGLFGYTQGNLQNLSSYQYEENIELPSDLQSSDYLVSGRNYVGGTIGQHGGSGNITTIKNTNSVIKGTGNYIGGNIGYGSNNYKSGLTSTQNIISGANYVGGNCGIFNGGSTNMINSLNTDNMTSTNNKITATGSYVGGNIGQAYFASNITSINNKIKGASYIGGCIGYATNSVQNALSSGTQQEITGTGSYIGGVIGRTNNILREVKAEYCKVIGTGTNGNYIGGIVGSSEFTRTGISTTNNNYYSIAGAYAYQVTVNASSNYVGGISGYSLGTIYGAIVENCDITTSGERAGGISGYYTGYNGNSASYISSSNFFMFHSYVVDSNIQATKYAGGLIGYFQYGNVQYCYVGNTNVKATEYVAGGLIGYFNNSKLSNLQYKATIKYNYIANTQNDKLVSAIDSVGGLIGATAQNLNYDEEIEKYNYIECNLIATDISTELGSYIDMGIGSVDQSDYGTWQGQYMDNIYIYNCSELNGVQVGNIIEENEIYNMLNKTELATSSTFSQNTRIYDDEGTVIGNTGLNFGTARYDYEDGFFPILKTKYSNAETYWGPTYWNVTQNKIATPNRVEDFTEPTVSLFTTDISLTSLDTLELETSTMSMMSLARVAPFVLAEQEEEVLPDIYIYAVDIDKINIEFSEVSSNTKFSITSNDNVIVEKQNVTRQVYTLNYDFNTPLQITVSNANYWYTQDINKENTQNLLSIVGDEYFYILNDSLYSNKREIDGEIVNIYNDKALDSSGNIYNISTMNKLYNEQVEIKLLDEVVPITQGEYKETTIQTFYHCSKVIQSDGEETYKNQQMIVKNGILYVIDGNMETKGNSVIVDSYNNNQYESILGEDGVIYDLLSKIKYPSEFVNSDIIAMTNNLDNESNIVLVYYSGGKVYGFNYITGEEVYDNDIEAQYETVSFMSYFLSSLSLDSVKYEINNDDYIEAQELTEKLEKVSVEEAIENISESKANTVENNTENNIESTTENEIDSNSNEQINDNDNKITTNNKYDSKEKSYVTTYDAETQKYVVYDEDELLSTASIKVSTENEKIDNNPELVSYYNNISVSKKSLENIGILVISIIVLTICSSLIIMYKKNNK